MRVILASGSAYRAAQLKRLLDWFEIEPAEVDETPLEGEAPRVLSLRLATAKAAALGERTGQLVLGSDQVASHQGQALGKPGSIEAAVAQLMRFSGDQVRFYTSAVLRDDTGETCAHTDLTTVTFRQFNETQAAAYVQRDQPLDCAGAFKIEGSAAWLIESVETNDPSALIGLPLHWLAGEFLSRNIGPASHN
ncbi:MAG: Maf family protein [Pseudomonadota bacterium]